MKRFPVLRDRQRGMPRFVPWDLLAAHESQALMNHGQTLDALAKRGGLSPQEMWCVVHDLRWTGRASMDTAEAWLEDVACVCRACNGEGVLHDVKPRRVCSYCDGSGWDQP